MNKVARFRLNAGNKYGLGHFTRCYALAQLLKDKIDIYFYIYASNYSIITGLNIDNFPVKFLDIEENIFLNDIEKSDVVIVDGYDFNDFYFLNIKARCNKLIVFDDFNANIKNVDAIINPFLEKIFINNNNIKYFIGYEYFILRKEFLKPITFNKRKGTIISMGGTDPNDISTKIISIILNNDIFKPIHVVYTGSYSTKQLNYFLNLSQQNLIVGQFMKSAGELCAIMDSCKYCIFPASNVLLEGIKRKLICEFGYYVNNQKNNYESLLANRVGVGLDNFNLYLLNNNLILLERTNTVNTDFVKNLSSRVYDIIDFILND